MLEVILQVGWLAIAIWMLKNAYEANKKAEPFSLRDLTNTKKAEESFDSMYMAGWFVIAAAMITMLVYKLITCGLVCGII